MSDANSLTLPFVWFSPSSTAALLSHISSDHSCLYLVGDKFLDLLDDDDGDIDDDDKDDDDDDEGIDDDDDGGGGGGDDDDG